MDHIDKHLASAATDPLYSPAMHTALGIGKHTLNRYYNKTDYSEVYRIAMGKSLLSLYFLKSDSTFFSSPSTSQATVLQECWLGG